MQNQFYQKNANKVIFFIWEDSRKLLNGSLQFILKTAKISLISHINI